MQFKINRQNEVDKILSQYVRVRDRVPVSTEQQRMFKNLDFHFVINTIK